MQLSVVRNLILEGCSNDIAASGLLVIDAVGWRSMYFVVMPRVNLIVILVTYARYLSYGETPLVNCGPQSNFLYIAITVYFTRTVYYLAYYYCFPLDTLNPLFIANQWDWQPHRKLGAKFLVVLCAGSMLLLVQSKALDEAPYKLSRAVAKLAGITFWSLPFSYWFDKPRFLTEGRFATLLIIPSSWGSQLGGYTARIKLFFWRHCRGKRRFL
jgi:hypothetical protein